MPKHQFFTVSYGIVLVLVIIWLLHQVQFVFHPIVIAFQTLFIPFLLAGVLFYLMRPLVSFLLEKKVPRVLSILLIYVFLLSVLTAIGMAIGPLLQAQINRLIDNAPEIGKMLMEQWDYFQTNQAQFPEFVDEWIQSATVGAQAILESIGRNLGNIVGGLASFLVMLVIIPFILFYMLKDGHHLSDGIVQFIPKENRKEAKDVLFDMNKALNTYVMGQVIVSVCVGIMVFIWYTIIGLEYSLILALVAMFTNLIPFVGPFIGTFPAVIVGLIESPWMMLQVIFGVIIVQQIESNLISPQVMGRALDVHPLTIILLLLVGGSLVGLFGLILAVPVYAVLKVVVRHAVRLYRLRYST